MHISLGAHTFVMPTPVFLVGVYDDEKRPNIMTAAWGGIIGSRPPCLGVSLRPATWTHRCLMTRAGFTVSIPSAAQAAQADYAGIVSGEKENKFETLRLTPIPGEHVDAPYVAECPLALELSLRQRVEAGSHTQFVGEIMDVKIRKDCLNPDGMPDMAKINALAYSPLTREYYAVGEFAARAFAVGKTIRSLD